MLNKLSHFVCYLQRELCENHSPFRCEDPWEFPLAQLFILETVGRGAFGEVRKAIAKGLLNDNEEVIVAVKQAKKGGKFKCNRVL